MSAFINPNDISPFTVDEYKVSAIAFVLNKAWYYEWNEKDQVWSKISEKDPPPPSTLAPGKFDGQIVEIPKD